MSWNTLLLQCPTDGIWFKKNWITTDSLLHFYTAYFNEYLNQNCYDSHLLKFIHALKFFFLSLLNYSPISFFKIYIWLCHFPDLMDFSYSALRAKFFLWPPWSFILCSIPPLSLYLLSPSSTQAFENASFSCRLFPHVVTSAWNVLPCSPHILIYSYPASLKPYIRSE